MHEVESIDELDEFISYNDGYVIMLYFGASWCGPCKLLKEKLSTQDSFERMPLLKVVYIDIDKSDGIASLYKIITLPTQIFVKLYDLKVKIASRIEGYDYTKLLLDYDNYVNKLLNTT